MKAVIIQAIRDYYKPEGHPFDRERIKKEVRDWVKNRKGTFNLCAFAWDKTPEILQSMMLNKINEIDNGLTLLPKKYNKL